MCVFDKYLFNCMTHLGVPESSFPFWSMKNFLSPNALQKPQESHPSATKFRVPFHYISTT